MCTAQTMTLCVKPLSFKPGFSLV